ncbi:MAG: hypothetical protein ACFB0D_04545 [Phormidesmis sp.]
MKPTTAYRFSTNQAYWPMPQVSSPQASLDQGSKTSLRTRLSSLLRSLVAPLTVSAEPRVWTSKNTAGHTLWNAYDALSDRVIRNASETELRIWLETRHYF